LLYAKYPFVTGDLLYTQNRWRCEFSTRRFFAN